MPLSQVLDGSIQALLPGTTQALKLENREVGGVGNAAADLSSSTNVCQVNSYRG